MLEIDGIQASIREHLLGRVEGEERERFEERFLTDSEFRELVLLIEGELIDDYEAALLSDVDRERFINQYVNAPNRKHDVRFNAALREYAIQAARSSAVGPQPRRPEHNLSKLFTKRRWVPLLATGALGFVALIGLWSAIANWVWRDHAADLSAEVALLNKPPASSEPLFSVVLQLIQNRSTGEEQKVLIPVDRSIVELQCPLPNTSYRYYQTTLRVVNDSEVFTVDQLQAITNGDGKTLHLRVPARILTPQDYILSVKGMTQEDRFEDVADYFFRIVK